MVKIMKVFRCEHQEIKEQRGRFFVGPWSENGWANFPDQKMAFEVVLHFGESIADWSALNWKGPRGDDFLIRSGFNSKYLAGVEKEDDLSFLKEWLDFLELAGFVIREYECSEEYVLIAREFDRRYLATFNLWSFAESGELGQPNQVVFHWNHARLIS